MIGSLGDADQISTVLHNRGWNEYRIIGRGNRFIHVINGRVTADVTDEQSDECALSGILAL
ncbi:MAG: family 16 glycoside hydrolase [Acidobacteriota bacterium]